jgi:hypothetical protein
VGDDEAAMLALSVFADRVVVEIARWHTTNADPSRLLPADAAARPLAAYQPS